MPHLCHQDHERGASAVEYGLLIAGVAAVIMASIILSGGGVTGLFSDTCTTLASTQTSASCSR